MVKQGYLSLQSEAPRDGGTLVGLLLPHPLHPIDYPIPEVLMVSKPYRVCLGCQEAGSPPKPD